MGTAYILSARIFSPAPFNMNSVRRTFSFSSYDFYGSHCAIMKLQVRKSNKQVCLRPREKEAAGSEFEPKDCILEMLSCGSQRQHHCLFPHHSSPPIVCVCVCMCILSWVFQRGKVSTKETEYVIHSCIQLFLSMALSPLQKN